MGGFHPEAEDKKKRNEGFSFTVRFLKFIFYFFAGLI